MSEFEDFKLLDGEYYIRNEQQFAGRNQIEDKSLNPKAVYCPNDHCDAELWMIERLPNGRLKLLARGAPTGVINKLLFAFLIERAKAEEWIITKRKHHGSRSLFTIETADKSAGWVKQPGEEDPQIAVQPLVVLPTLPPQYPRNALWSIQLHVD